MNIFKRAVNKLTELRYSPSYDGYYVDGNPGLLGNLIGARSRGVTVTPDTALTYSAFWACVKVVSETVATQPLHIYRRRSDGGRERADKHPLYYLLHDEPNPEMTSFQFIETMMGHLLTWGNFYGSIVRSKRGKMPGQIWPLNPAKMQVYIGDDGRRGYLYTLPSGERRKLPAADVLHVMGPSRDGMTGMSPTMQAADAIALGLNAEDFANEYYKNGLVLSGVFTHPGKLSDVARKNLKESLSKSKTGVGQRHRWMILQEAMSYQQLGVAPEAAQMLETRKLSVVEMCRIHRVQPHKIMHLDNATFSNIEHQAIEFGTDTILPWNRRVESELQRQLLDEKDRRDYFCEFLMDGLLRGDVKTRYEAYGMAMQNGWMTINEARRLERMNPSDQDGADILYKQNIWTEVGAKAPTPTQPLTDQPSDDEPEQDEDKEEKSAPRVEVRSAGVADRNALRVQYDPLFRDSAKRIVRIEVSELRAAVKKHFANRSVMEFEQWLDEYYDKFPAKIEKNFTPLVQSYGAAISDVASREAGGDGVSQAELDAFAKGYVEVSGKRHVGSSRGQIKKIIREASPEEMEALLNERIDEWDERRAEKMAAREKVEASDAFAKMAWVVAGVTRYQWVAQGDKPCPYCEELNGMIVGIDQHFVPADGSVSPEGQEPMQVSGARMHAPLHTGCVCSVVPA